MEIKYDAKEQNPQVIHSPEAQNFNINPVYLPSHRDWAVESPNTHMPMMGSSSPKDPAYINGISNISSTLSGGYSNNENYEISRKPIESLVGILLYISQHSEMKTKYSDMVRDFVPNYGDYEILRKRGNRHMVLYRRINTDAPMDISGLGDGVLTIMTICACLLIFESQQMGGGTAIQLPNLIVIDEPELYLHPQAQKKLYEALKKIAKNIQVNICHSLPLFCRLVCDQGWSTYYPCR